MSNRPERLDNEVRTTNATGGQKGVKSSRLDLLPPEALDELARVYGMGADKYTDTNYLKGYEYNKSLGAMQRHINMWERGEDYDEESGLHHLAHAAWHCFTLMTFQWNELGTDTRLQPHLDAGTMDQLHELYESKEDEVKENPKIKGENVPTEDYCTWYQSGKHIFIPVHEDWECDCGWTKAILDAGDFYKASGQVNVWNSEIDED